ncbi:hypothetical protein ZIOFF_047510 [Zingiber officinale]|uniref:Uncharacterized protein n=1 Tax=Zingiber officinale TaxID=94328 RepID=A0A8J5FV17_ZINOF|nr:hypothetical protein ZIOFF_047510 [Zingiber officinale]
MPEAKGAISAPKEADADGGSIGKFVTEVFGTEDVFPVPRLSKTQGGTGGFGSTSKTLAIFDKLLPREAATMLCEEESPLDDLDGNSAGTTSPWASVLRSTDLSLDTSEPEDDYL